MPLQANTTRGRTAFAAAMAASRFARRIPGVIQATRMLRGAVPVELAASSIRCAPAVRRTIARGLSRPSVVGTMLDHFFAAAPPPAKPNPRERAAGGADRDWPGPAPSPAGAR